MKKRTTPTPDITRNNKAARLTPENRNPQFRSPASVLTLTIRATTVDLPRASTDRPCHSIFPISTKSRASVNGSSRTGGKMISTRPPCCGAKPTFPSGSSSKSRSPTTLKGAEFSSRPASTAPRRGLIWQTFCSARSAGFGAPSPSVPVWWASTASTPPRCLP